jgi:trans-aconitate 2-methyltransferase
MIVSGAYAFGDGAEAGERLAVVHRVFAPLTDGILDLATTDAPRAAMDLGCGPGHTTALLADRWPDAVLTAVESSPAFAAAARRRVPRVTVIEGDVTDPGVVAGHRADLVYARCLLAHLADVGAAVATWRRWVAPGGRLVLEEPERIDTDDDVFRRYLRATTAVVAARGATMLAGTLLHATTDCAAGVLIDRGVWYPVGTGDAATMFRLNLATIRHDPAAGLDSAEADELAAALAARGRDTTIGTIAWQVRQVVLGVPAG